MFGIWCHATYARSSWGVSCLGVQGKREGGRASWVRRERKREEPVSVIINNTFAFDVATVIFASACRDVVREQFQDHSNTGEKTLNQCFRRLLKAGLAFDAATSSESEKKEKKCVQGSSHSLPPPPPLYSPALLLLSCHPPFFPLSSLLTSVIVSFSLSKNIVFLPRCRG